MDIKKIAIYRDIDELIENECPAEYVNSIDNEIMDYLSHVNDFEPLSFMVVNDSLVVTYDNISGDVIGQDSVTDFINQSVDYARNEILC